SKKLAVFVLNKTRQFEFIPLRKRVPSPEILVQRVQPLVTLAHLPAGMGTGTAIEVPPGIRSVARWNYSESC
ncbi:MAG: hypothetical protein WAN81_22735, partial [Candidatus Binataceae bacterium]